MLAVQYTFDLSNSVYQKHLHKKIRAFTHVTTAEAEYAYDCSQEDFALVRQEFEQIYPSVNRLYRYVPKRKIPIVIYNDRLKMQQIMHWQSKSVPMGIYWLGQIHILAPSAWLGGGEEEQACGFRLLGPMAHEYTHYVVDYLTRGNYPRWLSEGLAQYTEQAMAKIPPFYLQSMEGEEYYTLEELEKCFDFLPNQPLAYLESLLAGEILIEQQSFEYVRRLLKSLKAGRRFNRLLAEEMLNYPTFNLLLREKLTNVRKNFAQSMAETPEWS